jgi:hypothetical protein
LAKGGVEVGGWDGVKEFWDVGIRVWKRFFKIIVTDMRAMWKRGPKERISRQGAKTQRVRQGKRPV